MRHRVHHRKLNRTSEHRKALRRNMSQSLIEHGRITTTVAKAKDIRPFFERLVTLAVKVRRRAADDDAAGALRARRVIHRLLGDRGIIASEHAEAYTGMSDAARSRTLRMASGRRYRTGEPRGRLAFTAESVVHRLIETIAPRFEDRPGGYLRLIHLPSRRVGDQSRLARVQLLGGEEAPVGLAKPDRSGRRRRADARYAAAIKASKAWSGGPSKSSKKAEPSAEAAEPSAQTDENAGEASDTKGSDD